ncbi:MAG: 6-phosphogluconolactonase [Nitrospiraceae bacterium]|nr:6-phosphogluconolactonase [Nitrospiraceae bacterium]
MKTDPAVRVSVFDDLDSLSRAAADIFLSVASDAIALRGRFSVALSGGSTPRRLYTLLASSAYQNRVDWSHVHLFWADERCVPPDHRASNFKLLSDTLLGRVFVPEKNIHRMHGEADAEEAAREYENQLSHFFGSSSLPAFDLIMLGMGEDGHTASLFPGSPAVREKKRMVVPVYLDKPNIDRITLTLPVINHAARVLFLAAGKTKAGVIHHILGEGNSREYPAGLVCPESGTITWFLDQEAAGKS